MADVRLDPELLRGWPLPEYGEGKDERGAIAIVAGSPQVPGAAILAATAALRAGAGKLQIGTCRSVAAHVAIAVPEALVFALDETAEGALAPSAAGAVAEHANAADAVVLGPGFAADEANARLVAEVARRIEVPAVVDAAAMWCLREAEEALAPLRGRVVITPHAGEMADLLNVERGEVERDKVRFARDAARRFGAVVALKGAETVLATPDGAVYRHTGGDAGLGTSGSGDVLAGIAGGLLARGADPLRAAAWAIVLHARAGAELSRRIGVGFLARELPGEIPALMRWLC
ncbi:MAG TPA: NAD(P)H-hydrate dehydratase [Candidatus Baltobacteraceae bacterium]|nr:NAD(P)H-hydrate dehydratase [Candidatus Baltobacteraceae bacterium]